MSSIATLEARLRAADARVRAMRALEGAVWGAAVALMIAAIARFAEWISRAQLGPLAAWLGPLGWLAFVPVFGAVVAACREVGRLPLLTALDRSCGLSDLLSSAWAFTRLPDTQRAPFVQLTIARAEHAAAAVEVRRSFPWHRPRGLGWLAVAMVAAAATRVGLPSQPSAARPVGSVRPSRPLEQLVSPAQLARFRERLARIDAGTDERAAAVRAELDQVVDELGRGPADRMHVLRRLGELERQLRSATNAERTGSAASLDAPRRISMASRSSPAPDATAAHVASALAEPLAPPAPAEAAAPPPTSAEATTPPAPPPRAARPGAPQPQVAGSPAPAARREADPSPPDPAQPPPPSQPGGRNSAPPASKEARPVAAAPSQPGDDQAPRGPDLQRNRPEQPAERQRAENLAQAISELRDLMRRDQSVQADLGEPAQAPPHHDRAADPARDDSAGNRTGAPNAAYARGGPPPAVGTESAESGREDTPPLPAATTRISGAHSAGPVRSQVIYGAAQRGFAGSDYARVHAEYEDHAERELEHEAVPPGYRGYVRRYFEAIAPRKTP